MRVLSLLLINTVAYGSCSQLVSIGVLLISARKLGLAGKVPYTPSQNEAAWVSNTVHVQASQQTWAIITAQM